MADIIEIEITEDGLIKAATDKISMPNHMGAEAFMRECARLAGGKVEVKKKHGIVSNQQSQQKPLEQ